MEKRSQEQEVHVEKVELEKRSQEQEVQVEKVELLPVLLQKWQVLGDQPVLRSSSRRQLA